MPAIYICTKLSKGCLWFGCTDQSRSIDKFWGGSGPGVRTGDLVCVPRLLGYGKHYKNSLETSPFKHSEQTPHKHTHTSRNGYQESVQVHRGSRSRYPDLSL